MRVFAWSDLHLESRSNFELVKQFCKLHHRRGASPAHSVQRRSGDLNTSCPDSNASSEGRYSPSTPSGRDCALPDIDAHPVRHSSFGENIGKLWESIKGTAAPMCEDLAQDVLILAGDVHYDMEGLKECLTLFRSVFGHVAFVPGNHELWVTQKDRESGIGDSLQKLDSILLLCESVGVHTKPFSPVEGVQIVPLLSWYDELDPQFCAAVSSRQPMFRLPMAAQSRPSSPAHGSSSKFGASGPYNHKALMSLSENWMDYSACKWPHPLCNNDPRNGARPYTQARYEPDMVSTQRLNATRLAQNKSCTLVDVTSTAATGLSIVITPPSAARLERDKTANELSKASATSAGSSCYVWPAQTAKEKAGALLPSRQRRRTTDSLGMPLSLADFFALENERRGCFAQKASVRSSEHFNPPQNEVDTGIGSSVADAPVADGNHADLAGEIHTQDAKEQGSQGARAATYSAVASVRIDGHGPGSCQGNSLVITFSHFLPRAELATIYPLTPSALAYVMGSTRIDEQLRQAGSSVHVFGHSHINTDVKIEVKPANCFIHRTAAWSQLTIAVVESPGLDFGIITYKAATRSRVYVAQGVRYIQHSLGRPSEQKWFPGRRKPKVIFDVATEPGRCTSRSRA